MPAADRASSHLKLWGKTIATGGFHPLACHLLDVAAAADALLAASTHRRQTAKHLLDLPSDDHLTHLSFWAALHDLGKATPCFQRIAADQHNRLRQLGWAFPLAATTSIPHAQMTAGLLRIGTGLVVPDLHDSWRRPLSIALCGHHGLFAVTQNETAMGATDARWRASQSALIADLRHSINPATVSDWPDGDAVPPAAWAWFAGFVTLADWIASNTAWFPAVADHEGLDLPRYYAERRRLAAAIVRNHGFAEPVMAPARATFAEMFGRAPRPLQSVVEGIYRVDEPASGARLVIIEAPMGEGKTEAALYAAAAGDAGLAAGMYIGLPTQATSNQMYTRVEKFLRQQARQAVQFSLLHGQASLNQDYRRLAVATINRDESETLLAEEWFAGAKRGLLAPFAVGTIDQALMSVLQVRHHCLRGMALAGKTIIIDEVHAYDVYTSTIIDRLVQWLSALNARVVLLSATLPRQRVRDLAMKFGGTCADLADYPRVTTIGNGSSSSIAIPMPPDARRKTIGVNLAAESEEQTARWLTDRVAAGGCAVWIRNTVKDAQAAFSLIRALDPSVPVKLFHARFRAGDRNAIERGCLAAFGPNGPRPDRCILVATQVVEQSLDLDFDVMVSDHAPVDLLLQRAGRLHRHQRPRPAHLVHPLLHIKLPETTSTDAVPSFGSSEYVYQRLILLRSLLTLRGRHEIRLPEDIEPTIESVYGEQPITATNAMWSAALATAARKADDEAEEAELRARTCCVAPPASWDPLDSSLQLEEDDPSIHQSLQAATRDADPSLRLVFLYQRADGTVSDTPTGDPIDLADPSSGTVDRLLSAVINVQDRRVISRATRFSAPSGWARRAMLRYLLLAPLTCSQGTWSIELDSCCLHLDPQLGLVISERHHTRGTTLEAAT